MELGNISAVATSLAEAQTSDQIDIAVFKKALDSQDALAAGLLAALPPPSAPLTSSIGHTIDTQA